MMKWAATVVLESTGVQLTKSGDDSTTKGIAPQELRVNWNCPFVQTGELRFKFESVDRAAEVNQNPTNTDAQAAAIGRGCRIL